MTKTRFCRSWFSIILTAAVIAALSFYIYSNFEKVMEHDFQFRCPLLLAAFAAACAGYLALFLAWEKLSSSFGLTAPRAKAARAFYASQLGKYIPGKFGLVLIRLNAYRGYSRKKVAIATGVEYIASFISACILVLLALSFPDTGFPDYLNWLAPVLLILLLVALWPPILKRFSNFLLRLLRRDEIDIVPSFGRMLSFVMLYVIVGLFFGLSLFLVLNSLETLEFRYYLAVTGTFWAAALIGIAAVFAPSGIGVREGVLIVVLPAFVPEPAVIVGAILIRLVLVGAELSLAGLTLVMDRASREEGPG